MRAVRALYPSTLICLGMGVALSFAGWRVPGLARPGTSLLMGAAAGLVLTIALLKRFMPKSSGTS